MWKRGRRLARLGVDVSAGATCPYHMISILMAGGGKARSADVPGVYCLPLKLYYMQMLRCLCTQSAYFFLRPSHILGPWLFSGQHIVNRCDKILKTPTGYLGFFVTKIARNRILWGITVRVQLISNLKNLSFTIWARFFMILVHVELLSSREGMTKMCGDLTIPLQRDWIVVDWSATKNHDETHCTFSQLCYYVISWSSAGDVLNIYNIIVYVH